MAAKKRVSPKAKTSRSPAQKKSAPASQPPPSAAGPKPAAARPATTARPRRGLPPNSASSIPVHRVKRPLPAKSVQKAANAFKNFSLSRFAKNATPANYVPAHQAKLPAAVAAVQRKSVTTQLAARTANPPPTLGMTVALTPTSLAALLPSLNSKAGTVDLTQLLGALQQNLRGKEFYAAGNPTLKLVQNFALLSQVQAYINALKAGTGGGVAPGAAAGTPTQAGGAAATPVASPAAAKGAATTKNRGA